MTGTARWETIEWKGGVAEPQGRLFRIHVRTRVGTSRTAFVVARNELEANMRGGLALKGFFDACFDNGIQIVERTVSAIGEDSEAARILQEASR